MRNPAPLPSLETFAPCSLLHEKLKMMVKVSPLPVHVITYDPPPPPLHVKSALFNASGLASSQELFPSFQNFLRIENRTIIKEISSRSVHKLT